MTAPDPSPSPPPPSRRPFQFGLKHLLLAFVPVAVLAAVAAKLGIGVIVCVLFLALPIAWFVSALRHGRGWQAGTAVAVLLFGGLLLLSATGSARHAARRAACTDNLKQIGLALENYCQTYGVYPPAVVRDGQGRPRHSWRALLLPYLGQSSLARQYRFDEPWDGPHNRALLAAMPSVYHCPAASGGAAGQTSYVAVIGPHTAWRDNASLGPPDITDPPAETIWVVEVADSGIAWSEPRDLHVRQLASGLNPARGQGISSRHSSGANVLFTDGHCQFLLDPLAPALLRALLTIDGGETVSGNSW